MPRVQKYPTSNKLIEYRVEDNCHICFVAYGHFIDPIMGKRGTKGKKRDCDLTASLFSPNMLWFVNSQIAKHYRVSVANKLC